MRCKYLGITTSHGTPTRALSERLSARRPGTETEWRIALDAVLFPGAPPSIVCVTEPLHTLQVALPCAVRLLVAQMGARRQTPAERLGLDSPSKSRLQTRRALRVAAQLRGVTAKAPDQAEVIRYTRFVRLICEVLVVERRSHGSHFPGVPCVLSRRGLTIVNEGDLVALSEMVDIEVGRLDRPRKGLTRQARRSRALRAIRTAIRREALSNCV